MNEQEFMRAVKARVHKKDELIHMSNPELAEAVLVLNERVASLQATLEAFIKAHDEPEETNG